MKALEKSPERRYSSAEAFAQDLRHWLDDEPVSARPPLFWERFYRWSQRHQSRAILYTMAAVSVVILVVASAVMNVLLTSGQSRLEEAMHRSEMLRAGLLRDFASRLLKTPGSLDEARSFLVDAASVRTGDLTQDYGIHLRLRALDRLGSSSSGPLPKWQGAGLERAWFTADGKLCLKTKTETLSLATNGETSVVEEVPPAPVATGNLEVSGRTLRVWADIEHRRQMGLPVKLSANIVRAELSPDRHFVAAITEDSQLTVSEVDTGLPITQPITVLNVASQILWEPKKHQVVMWDDHELTWFDW